MDQQQLSSEARAAIAAVQNLPQAEQATVVGIISLDLAAKIAGAVQTATPAQRAEASAKVVEGVAAATTPQKTAPVSEIQNINGYNAVVGQITVNGQQLDTLLSEGSFNKSRVNQERYAGEFGGARPYRMATREENRAYVAGLLAKEANKTINEAEENALRTYRERFVRDTQGGLDVDGRRVNDNDNNWNDNDNPNNGALFVRASAESK